MVDLLVGRCRARAGIGGIATACALALAATTPAHGAGLAHAAAACDGAEAPIAATTVAQSRAALACLIDTVRVERGLSALRDDDRLAETARDHAADMVQRDYFGHVTPAGADPTVRRRRAGWPPANTGWWAGEVLVQASGDATTPRRLVSAWLNSPGHRRILLSDHAALIGIGVVRNTPDGTHPRDGVTAAAELGRLCPAADPLSDYTDSRARQEPDAC
jgi:uncharacterized protein YkwD